jgi:H+/Cl- antiporter ClcA
MGGSISALFAKWYRVKHRDKRILLMCGMAAGFGAVFGTPITGAIFAMEVLAIGRIKYDALIPCFIASLLADLVCSAYHIHHTQYAIRDIAGGPHIFNFDFPLLAKVILAGAAFGLAGYMFAELSHFIKDTTTKYIRSKWLIPVIGGCTVIAVSYAIGNFDYLGLGVTSPVGGVSIVSAFSPGGADTWSWLFKLVLTAITLGTGFKGGEVTPLFFVGAALGNVLAGFTGAPVDLFAGLGFIAVFAGATNTPIACTLMGVELFGSDHLLYYAVACFTAYYFSGHSGIYSSQRLAVSKFHLTHRSEQTIKDIKLKGKR